MTIANRIDPGDSDVERRRGAMRLLAKHLGLSGGFKESELDRKIRLYGGEKQIQVEFYNVMLFLQERMVFGSASRGLNLVAPEIVHDDSAYRLGPKASLLLRMFEGGNTVSVDRAIAMIWPTWEPKTEKQERDGPPIKSLYSRVNRKLKELKLGTMIRRNGSHLCLGRRPTPAPKPAKKK